MEHNWTHDLQELGKENIFSLFSEQECRTFINQLETQLEHEEELAQTVENFKNTPLFADTETSSCTRTPPFGLPCITQAHLCSVSDTLEQQIPEPSLQPTPTEPIALEESQESKQPLEIKEPQRLGWSFRHVCMVMACVSFCTIGWSFALYTWAFERGVKQGAELAVSHFNRMPASNISFPQRKILAQPQLTSSIKWTATHPLLVQSAHPKKILGTSQKTVAMTFHKTSRIRLNWKPQQWKSSQLSPQLRNALRDHQKTLLFSKNKADLLLRKNTLPSIRWDVSERKYQLKPQKLSLQLSIWKNTPDTLFARVQSTDRVF